MHHVVGLLRYILYNLILNRIISGRWGTAVRTLLLVPPNADFAPTNFAAPPILETENYVASQCPEFYSEDFLMLSQAIYLGLLWLGLIVLLNPGANIVSWLQSTKTSLCICQVPEPVWFATASGRLTGPAAVWFTNWASQEIEGTWVSFKDAAKSRYSEKFSPTMAGTLLLAIKQTGSVP
ncbi:hypothetical protein DSO57_1004879 [Entomophthora muscae]|uniref:Uncharacterized protein n=1 Tax=Entomophthora muscae TaxID=34485 RepID=A0ACC2TVU4_9FUNG|nr:hypothetical protein DSO57_1004879 [Entomophthora muscae]